MMLPPIPETPEDASVSRLRALLAEVAERHPELESSR
jgi:hypothetical protein